jgi:hypothetical protein
LGSEPMRRFAVPSLTQTQKLGALGALGGSNPS